MAPALRPCEQRPTPSLTAMSRRAVVAASVRPMQAETQCFRAHRQPTTGIQPEVCR